MAIADALRVPSSGLVFRVGMYRSMNAVGSLAGESTVLDATTIPAGALAEDGDAVDLMAFGVFANNAGATTGLTLNFSGVHVVDVADLDTGLAAWTIRARVVRLSASEWKAFSELLIDGVAPIVRYVESHVFDPDTDLDVTYLAEGAAENDVTLMGSFIDYHTPAGFSGLVNFSVVETSPADGAVDVAFDDPITVTFNRPINPSNQNGFVLEPVEPPGLDITSSSFTLSEDATTATVVFDGLANNGGVFKLRVLSGITGVWPQGSLSNVHLSEDYVQENGFTLLTTPEVLDTSPANLEANVAQDAAITVTFTEAMDPGSIDETSVFLIDAGGGAADVATTSVAMSVGDTVATLTLDGPLTADGGYKIRVTTAALSAHSVPLAAPYTQEDGFTVEHETVAPTIVAVDPENSATEVSLTPTITVTFSEAMDPETVDETSVYLVAEGGGAADVATTDVTLSEGDTVATLVLEGPLSADTVYKVRVTTAVTDVVGNPLASQYTQTNGFTTGEPDVVAPTVDAVIPTDEATNVASDATIAVTFSEAMAISTMTPTNVILEFFFSADWVPLDGTAITMNLDNTVATIDYSASEMDETGVLYLGVTFRVRVTTDVTDLAGNHLESEYVQGTGFTTVFPDTTAPYVVSTSPADEATGILTSVHPTITFSEAMEPTMTINGPNDGTTTSLFCFLSLGGESPYPAGTWALDEAGLVATLTPTSPLAAGTSYKLGVSGMDVLGGEIKDLAGNLLNQIGHIGDLGSGSFEQATGFTTELAPTVASTSPADEATGVAVNAALTVTFDKAMDPATCTAANIKLVASDGGVADVATSSVAMSVGNTVATLTMAGDLSAATTYKFRVTTSVTDSHGNAIATQFTSANGFTTA